MLQSKRFVLALLMIAMALSFSPLPRACAQVLARVAQVQQLTQKKTGAGPYQRAGRGTTLSVGDTFRTGKRSKADIRFNDGSLLRLGQLSSVELRGAKEVALLSGRLLFSQLQPGRVVAGSGAAEIKGSVGVVEIEQGGHARFTLFSGAMDVSAGGPTVTMPPGHSLVANALGVLSTVRIAPPLAFADGDFRSELLDPPDDSPFAGSRRDEAERDFTPRAAIDEATTLGNRFVRDATPFQRRGPFPTPFPTQRPNSLAVKTNSFLNDRATTNPRATTSQRIAGNNGLWLDRGGFDPSSDHQLIEVRASRRSPSRPIGGRIAQAAPADGAAANGAANANPAEVNGAGTALTDAAPNAAVSNAAVSNAAVSNATVQDALDLDPAYRHIFAGNPNLGRGVGGDGAILGVGSDDGDSVYGARLHGYATRGKWFANVSLQPLQVRARLLGGGTRRTFDYSSVSNAFIDYRDRRFEVQAGRQRFLGGPVRAAFYGSLIRQGGREVMDAVRFSPNLGVKNRLEVAYIQDAFVRNLPFRVAGQQHALYARLSSERHGGNVGLNLLKYSDAPLSDSLGATLDFALPVARDALQIYGEVGRDTARRRLTTLGATFPSLYQKTDFDVFVEYARLRSSSLSAGPPAEWALRVYRNIGRDWDVVVAANRFSGADSSLTLGLSYGFHGGNRRSNR